MGRIYDLPILDRPREKCLRYGPESLSIEELITILIGSGIHNKSAKEIANELLNKVNGLVNLSNTNYSTLIQIDGINKVTALKLLATFELSKRLNIKLIEENEIEINDDYLFKKYSKTLLNKRKEHVVVVVLNKHKKIIHESIVNIGTNDKVNISVKDIISEVVSYQGYYFYLIHNHPNGEVLPSIEDIDFTLEVVRKCRSINLIMLDHLIINDKSYYSFKKEMLKK